MVVGVEEITRVALELSVEDRAKVADALLASLDGPNDDPVEVQEAWTMEIRSRVDDIRSGRVQTIGLDQIKVELAQRRTSRQR